MVYGAEAVLPSDIRHDSPRVAAYVEADNEKTCQEALDLLDEERDIAAARSVIYQQDPRRYHSRRVRTRTFQEGDLVLRLIQDQTDTHKLSPRWKDPLWSAKICTTDPTTSLMFESMKTHVNRRRRPTDPGILLNLGHITPEPQALRMYILKQSIYYD